MTISVGTGQFTWYIPVMGRYGIPCLFPSTYLETSRVKRFLKVSFSDTYRTEGRVKSNFPLHPEVAGQMLQIFPVVGALT